ncbi:MAG: hypothetical protein KDA52_06985 [Planctomycetaceae bacterium]|nr:hypothetical protein [Planctomycetaceae bacterium]
MNQLLKSDKVLFALALAFIGTAGLIVYVFVRPEAKPGSDPQRATAETTKSRVPSSRRGPERVQGFGRFGLWWDGIPEQLRETRVDTGEQTNITRADYSGPEACQKCHEKNYDAWSKHSHRWMNALADESTVKGDFSGEAGIDYLGGKGRFYREGDTFYMELVRDDVRHLSEITQTIGSRFYQYYVGRQLEGPEPPDHPLYTEDHVLPFGYWLDREEWVPIVHVHERESLDNTVEENLHDPYLVQDSADGSDWGTYCDTTDNLYRSQCNFCHTTFPLGDMLVRDQKKMGLFVPVGLHLSMPDYVAKATPELWDSTREPWELADREFEPILREYRTFEAKEKAVTLGVSCEACHLGSKEHVENKDFKPAFFPCSPDLAIQTADGQMDFGRTHDNVNWACGRCHVGERPEFSSGISTWNSTEYSDALKGSCYSQLTCVECHNPHEAIGHQWTRTAAEDDASCLKCHQEFEPSEARVAHTHHAADNEGSHCMNCHMPRINEGLQDIVRTHTIFSPTQRQMIESNEPNACNVCHVDRPIDWTIEHLKEWYGASFSESSLTQNYPDRDGPTAVGWLKSTNRFVRQVAADALTRENSVWALSEIIGALDDPYLLNRQFARIGLEGMLDIELSKYGYRFYMTPEEREVPLERMRDDLIPVTSPSEAEE